MATAILLLAMVVAVQRPVAMRELTVPNHLLPAGCVLAPAELVRLDGNRVRGGLWAGQPIATNPWSGGDRHVVATIRERIDGPVMVPDGPPPAHRDRARARLQLAGGVEEGYAAVCSQTEPDAGLIVVYALRFLAGGGAIARSGYARPDDPRHLRLAIGPWLLAVHDDGGECFQAVGAHLKSLAP